MHNNDLNCSKLVALSNHRFWKSVPLSDFGREKGVVVTVYSGGGR